MKVYDLVLRTRPRLTARSVLFASLLLAGLVLVGGSVAMQRAEAPPPSATAAPADLDRVPALLASDAEEQAYASALDSTLVLLHGAFLAGDPTLTRQADARLDDAAYALQDSSGWEVVWSERDVLLADARAAHLRQRLEVWGHAGRVRIVAQRGTPGIQARPLR
jgi:hypothetical protein